MIKLHTLGSVFLAAESGEALGGAAAQRRTLALLAILAVAGEGGMSRDKIVGLLWPDTDPERARHSLTQALYAARRALQADDLFSVNADIRVNRSRLACDVTELEAALHAGDLEQAVARYTGPFLDGFFLSGSSEFEQWRSRQRDRLETSVAKALEQLATRAEADGDHRRAVEWRKRISMLRPLDSANTVRLMTALAQAGDRASALQQARVHELMLREQLDLEPDPAVVELAKKLREAVGSRPAAADTTELASDPKSLGPPVAATPERAVPPRSPWAARAVLNARRPWTLAAILALLLLAAGIFLVRGRRSVPVGAQPLRQKVVVAPFRVAGASASLGYLRDGIVELLSTRLADDTTARAVDAGAVLDAWEAAGFTAAAAVPRDSVVKLAAKLGAERVVLGSVVGSPSRMILRASVVAVPSAAVQGEATVEGPADSISALIDGLAAKLLVSEAGEEERLASFTTGSLSALRAYLAAQAAFRQDDYPTAMRRYQRALELDPRFALAALHLADAADRLNDDEQRRRGISLAWSGREALSDRDLALLSALAGPKYPLPSYASEQLAAWRRMVEMAPNDADSWFSFGSRLFHDGALVGLAEPHTRASAALERAVSIAPDHVAASLVLLQLATRSDSIRPGPPWSDSIAAGSRHAFTPFVQWRIARARGDTVELRRLRGSLRRASSHSLRVIAMASQFDGVGATDGATALNLLGALASRRSERLDVILAQHSRLMQQGRPQAAADFSTRIAATQLGSNAHLRLRVLDWLYAEGDSAAAARAARELDTAGEGGLTAGAFTSDNRLSDLCVLSQWRLMQRDTSGVGLAIEGLRKAGTTTRAPSPVTAAPAVCAELLEAWLAVVTSPAGALTRIERLDSLALTSAAAGDAVTYAPILLARLFENVGQPHRALQAIRKRVYMSGWPRYLATAWREEGRLSQLVGDRGTAQRAYERYLALRPSPEEGVLPQLNEVRQQLRSAVTPGSR